MKIYSILKMGIFLIFFCFTSNNFAQSADSLQYNDRSVDPGEIIEAGESIIKVEVEKPQVQLFSQRVKPEFDEVNLEKSFAREIMDEGQSITLQNSPEKIRKKIDIEKLINKNR